MGQARHIDIGLLWIQQTAADQRLKSQKVLGKHNPADLLTKHLDQATSEGHTQTLHYKRSIGRAREAPTLHILWKSVGDIMLNNIQKESQFLRVSLG